MPIYFNMRILCVINMYALLVNGCCDTVACILLLFSNYNMLVLLVVFVRYVGVRKMFALLVQLGCLQVK